LRRAASARSIRPAVGLPHTTGRLQVGLRRKLGRLPRPHRCRARAAMDLLVAATPSLASTPMSERPRRIAGNLWKRRNSALMLLSGWRRRHAVLENGCLIWLQPSADDGRADDGAQARMLFRGTLDLAKTACEVSEVAGNTTQFELRPLQGSVWRCDGMRHEGTSRRFVFDVSGSEFSRAEWLRSIEDHMAFAQQESERLFQRGSSDTSPCRIRLDPVPADVVASLGGEACPVCLADLADLADPADAAGEGEPAAVRTACGHRFHASCARTWLLSSPTCPVCRSELAEAADRPASLGA